MPETLTTDLIIGRDFLKQHRCSVELGERDQRRLTQVGIALPLGCKGCQQMASVAVVTHETFCVPPLCEMETVAKAPTATKAQTSLVESCLPGERNAVVVARAMVTPKDEPIPVNPRLEPVSLKKGDEIAQMEPIPEEAAVAATTVQEQAEVQEDHQTGLVAQASSRLSTEEQEQLFARPVPYAQHTSHP